MRRIESHGMNGMEWNGMLLWPHIPTTTPLATITTVSFIFVHVRVFIERNLLEPPFLEGARTVPLTCWFVLHSIEHVIRQQK